MIKQYIQQAIYQLRAQPVLSAISILGTALAICLIMVIVMMQQVKTEPYAPESNRDRMLYVKWMTVYEKNGSIENSSNSPLSLKTARTCGRSLTTAEAVTVYSMYSSMEAAIPKGSPLSVDVKQTDEQFWKVFNLSFVDGKPFDEASSEAGLKVAVISESVAKALYGTVKVVGHQLELDYSSYKIVGIVKDVSTLASEAYAQVWIPYFSTDIQNMTWNAELMGLMRVAILANSKDDFSKIRAEFDAKVKEYGDGLKEAAISFRGQPDNQEVFSYRKWANMEPDMKSVHNRRMLIFALLLLIPAINLSSMTQSRLNQRITEIGIRRSFGCSRGDIMWQVFCENLVLTFVAGFIGVLLCFGFVLAFGSSLLATSTLAMNNSAPVVNLFMLMHFSTFVYAFLFCLLMNLLSSGFPAWRASRVAITNALNNH